MMKKLLIMMVCLSMLTACAPTTDQTPEPAAEVSAQTVELTGDTVILTVDGQPVYWPEFNYYLAYIVDYYKATNVLEEITDWDAVVDGKALEEYFLDYAVSLSKNHRGLEKKAAQLDAGLTAEQRAAIDDTISNGEAVYGAGEYRRMVEESYNTIDVFRYLQQTGYLTDNLFLLLYGQQGELCDDDAVSEYAEKNEYMCVKFICVEDTADNRQLMNELSSRLGNSDDQDALFDELMDEYSQYTTMNSTAFPDGQLFGKGYLGDAFDKGYSALAEGEISSVLEGPNELYIIQRLPLDPDGAKNEGGFTLRHCVAYALFEQDMEVWGNELEYAFDDGYYAIDVRAFD